LIDSHCHLDDKAFENETDAIVMRAAQKGVGCLLTMGTRLSTANRVVALAEKYPAVYGAVGIHPEYADEEAPFADADAFLKAAAHPKIVAVGETGLDYHYAPETADVQKKIFRFQLQIAKRAGLPVCIHARDADDDMAAILREESDNGRLTGVIHCFSSGRGLAETALELGFYISASGIVTFNKSDALRDIFKDVPLNRLLVETDCPYLAPVPFRGKRNEPSFVCETAARLAALKSVSYEELAAATTENFYTLFKKAS